MTAIRILGYDSADRNKTKIQTDVCPETLCIPSKPPFLFFYKIIIT